MNLNIKNIFKTHELKISKSWLVHMGIAIPRFSGMLILSLNYGSKKFGVPWTPEEKGLSFFEISPKFVDYIGGLDVWFSAAPLLFAWLAGFSEVIAALFVALGFQTRFFAGMVLITMSVAMYQHLGDPMKNLLPSLCFVWLALYSVVLGSGKFGLDHWINKKIKA